MINSSGFAGRTQGGSTAPFFLFDDCTILVKCIFSFLFFCLPICLCPIVIGQKPCDPEVVPTNNVVVSLNLEGKEGLLDIGKVIEGQISVVPIKIDNRVGVEVDSLSVKTTCGCIRVNCESRTVGVGKCVDGEIRVKPRGEDVLQKLEFMGNFVDASGTLHSDTVVRKLTIRAKTISPVSLTRRQIGLKNGELENGGQLEVIPYDGFRVLNCSLIGEPGVKLTSRVEDNRIFCALSFEDNQKVDSAKIVDISLLLHVEYERISASKGTGDGPFAIDKDIRILSTNTPRFSPSPVHGKLSGGVFTSRFVFFDGNWGMKDPSFFLVLRENGKTRKVKCADSQIREISSGRFVIRADFKVDEVSSVEQMTIQINSGDSVRAIAR
jgi:hypothetical protein